MQLLNGHIEGLILNILLRDGSLSTKELLGKVFADRSCTRQGMYRALRKLKTEEKIVVYKSAVSINNFWREQLQSLLTANDPAVTIVGDVRGLKKDDRISLRLHGLSIADQVWSHIFIPIEKELSPQHPLFLYNPHNWTALLREETDRVHAQRLEQNRRPTYLLIGSVTRLDKTVTRSMEFKYLEYSFSSSSRFPFYIAVIGDYIFQMKLLGDGNVKIDSIFSTEHDVTIAKDLLAKLDSQKIKCRIIIEKSPLKAVQWKKRIGKDFYIPKKYRDF